MAHTTKVIIDLISDDEEDNFSTAVGQQLNDRCRFASPIDLTGEADVLESRLVVHCVLKHAALMSI